MYVASSLRSNGAVIIDLMLAFFAMQIVAAILKLIGLFSADTTSLSGVLAVFVFGYPFLAHRSKVPSFGKWVLGTRAYPYSALTDYAGKGKLVVFEPLADAIYLRRAITAASLFGILYGVATMLSNTGAA